MEIKMLEFDSQMEERESLKKLAPINSIRCPNAPEITIEMLRERLFEIYEEDGTPCLFRQGKVSNGFFGESTDGLFLFHPKYMYDYFRIVIHLPELVLPLLSIFTLAEKVYKCVKKLSQIPQYLMGVVQEVFPQVYGGVMLLELDSQ